MSCVLNKVLYLGIEEEAKRKFKRYQSAYASLWIRERRLIKREAVDMMRTNVKQNC